MAEFAHRLAERIASRHPELKIDPGKVRIAGLLHDIGRSRDGDHELNSIDILPAEGLPEIAAEYPLSRGLEAFEHARRKGTLKVIVEC